MMTLSMTYVHGKYIILIVNIILIVYIVYINSILIVILR